MRAMVGLRHSTAKLRIREILVGERQVLRICDQVAVASCAIVGSAARSTCRCAHAVQSSGAAAAHARRSHIAATFAASPKERLQLPSSWPETTGILKRSKRQRRLDGDVRVYRRHQLVHEQPLLPVGTEACACAACRLIFQLRANQ